LSIGLSGAAGAARGAVRWRRVSALQLVTQPVGAGLACYSCPSGETHILDAFPAEIFRQLPERSPGVSAEAVAESIAGEFDEATAAWRGRVESALEQMARLALVVSDDP
jgi:PqqD family protein of HPr-rel-A system